MLLKEEKLKKIIRECVSKVYKEVMLNETIYYDDLRNHYDYVLAGTYFPYYTFYEVKLYNNKGNAVKTFAVNAQDEYEALNKAVFKCQKSGLKTYFVTIAQSEDMADDYMEENDVEDSYEEIMDYYGLEYIETTEYGAKEDCLIFNDHYEVKQIDVDFK